MDRPLVIAVAALAVLAAVACGGAPGHRGTPAGETERAVAATDREAAAAQPAIAGAPADRLGRWRWDGARARCFFVAKNRCFVTRRAACETLACGGRCAEDGAAPARVTCVHDGE